MRRRILLNAPKQLKVEPTTVQWIDVISPVVYTIKTNTKWNVH